MVSGLWYMHGGLSASACALLFSQVNNIKAVHRTEASENVGKHRQVIIHQDASSAKTVHSRADRSVCWRASKAPVSRASVSAVTETVKVTARRTEAVVAQPTGSSSASHNTSKELLEWRSLAADRVADSGRSQGVVAPDARVALQFGWRYQHGADIHETNPAKICSVETPFPHWLLPAKSALEEQVSHVLGKRITFNQCIVNRYLKGQGIRNHIDHQVFGNVIACISVGASAFVNFWDPQTKEECDLLVRSGSFYIMSGDVRTSWFHGMPMGQPMEDNGGIRYSFTFRTVDLPMTIMIEPSSLSKPTLPISLVTQELLRKRLYDEDVQWLASTHLKHFTGNQVVLFMLRILFNKIMERDSKSQTCFDTANALAGDPVFISEHSQVARLQILKDLEYKQKNMDHTQLAQTIADEIDARWYAHSIELRTNLSASVQHQSPSSVTTSNESDDSRVTLSGGFLRCHGMAFADIQGLGSRYPQHLDALFAVHLRYRYIGLGHQGAARDFAEMGWQKDQAVEGFASTLNHYFDTYCSAFPDIEAPFGSIGSYWKMSQMDEFWKLRPHVIVNPPPNSSIVEAVVAQLCRLCHETSATSSSTGGHPSCTVHMTFPHWPDMTINHTMQQHPCTTHFKVCPALSVPFINHIHNVRSMNGNPVIEWQLKMY